MGAKVCSPEAGAGLLHASSPSGSSLILSCSPAWLLAAPSRWAQEARGRAQTRSLMGQGGHGTGQSWALGERDFFSLGASMLRILRAQSCCFCSCGERLLLNEAEEREKALRHGETSPGAIAGANQRAPGPSPASCKFFLLMQSLSFWNSPERVWVECVPHYNGKTPGATTVQDLGIETASNPTLALRLQTPGCSNYYGTCFLKQ